MRKMYWETFSPSCMVSILFFWNDLHSIRRNLISFRKGIIQYINVVHCCFRTKGIISVWLAMGKYSLKNKWASRASVISTNVV